MTVRDLLVRRSGRVVLPLGPGGGDERLVTAVELELAALGFVASHRLRARLLCLDSGALAEQKRWLCETLAALLGANQQHKPLFRKFPSGVPRDTLRLWVQKVLVHYLQGEEEPCLTCGRVGTTHVLKPCRHVVCDVCFDGSNYSRCPVCEHAVDTRSPFFRPDLVDRSLSVKEKVTFKLLDLCEDMDAEVGRLFGSLCARAQAMSPDDVAALATITSEYGQRVLEWTPEKIPVRENRAHVFGALLRAQPTEAVLAAARPHIGTATDVLRLVAVYSGADPSLQATARGATDKEGEAARWSPRTREHIQRTRETYRRYRYKTAVSVQIKSTRFKVAKLSRPLRRALLGLLESLPPDALVEDMLRRPSPWVALGEALHPFEHATRFPNTARAFAVARGSTGPLVDALAAGVASHPSYERDAEGRLRYVSFNSRTERLIAAGDGPGLGQHLSARPGELARRLDLALRLEAASGRSGTAPRFLERVESMSFPTLLTVATGLKRRDAGWPVRVYFPQGAEWKAPSSHDKRRALSPVVVGPLVAGVERELLRRLSPLPHFGAALLDAALSTVIVPFNERTASPAAVSLPRGSSLRVPSGKVLRLFLHWCQPERGWDTDIDLSVGLYDESWNHIDTCSYYQLETRREGRVVARSSGDMRNAPHPDGASEFVDLHREDALATGVRYAVMVVNAYAGLPFNALERGFAGLMVRDDARGAVFDPRTVRLRFNLSGEHGVYMPLVLDLASGRLFWLDAYSTGQFAFNNVHTSNAAIQRICPETMAYFGHGVRPTMYQLAALHAAARTDRVIVRDRGGALGYERREMETDHTFYQRLVTGDADELLDEVPELEGPVFAALLEGDVELPAGSTAYALFREKLTETVAAADLLVGKSG